MRLIFTLGTVQKSENIIVRHLHQAEKYYTASPRRYIEAGTAASGADPSLGIGPAGTDRMNELLVEGDRLDNFNIK